ncbi:MAG: SUF system Fe-S cluster assembly protein [Flavobacteriales bacterium]|nr:SUF system Fe-S cluster assembly protein [Flavobacteriales bacterium]MDG1780731.1 SUF system Fe-S cluster assembly protein [Flavobacteriales bacterium]MDG2247299.1 SUF system Fe-S cluster assembly protein [Flavobacteriales bacterium]
MKKRELQDQIVVALKTIFDPEIPVDIYELGLIYEVKLDDEMNAVLQMTLTSPSCPVAESLPVEVEEKVASVDGVSSAKVEITFEPPWSQDMMSEEAKLELGFL